MFLDLMDDIVDSTTALCPALSIVHPPWNRNRYPETTLFSRAIHDREFTVRSRHHSEPFLLAG